jgi:nitroreductase
MEVYEAVRTLLAVRSYQDKPIPEESVRRILQAARLTGSSRNSQEWDFIVIRNEASLQQIGQRARTGGYVSGAPLAVAVVVPAAGNVGYIDGARAVQDMMLVAWEEGLGSNWVSNVDTPEIREMLGIPGDRRLLAIIPFGYPDRKLGKGKKARKPLSEIAHAEQFGQPYAAQ